MEFLKCWMPVADDIFRGCEKWPNWAGSFSSRPAVPPGFCGYRWPRGWIWGVVQPVLGRMGLVCEIPQGSTSWLLSVSPVRLGSLDNTTSEFQNLGGPYWSMTTLSKPSLNLRSWCPEFRELSPVSPEHPPPPAPPPNTGSPPPPHGCLWFFPRWSNTECLQGKGVLSLL